MIALRSVFTLAALAAALGLAGCGKQGDLQRPAPLYGRTVTPNAQTSTRQAAAARARRDTASTAHQAPQSADEVRNEGGQLPPPPVTGSPIPGTAPGPNPQPPPGGLPDPLHPASVPQ
ncbi:MAG TPA: lipoprotein [Caulobacteraceae bacterium]